MKKIDFRIIQTGTAAYQEMVALRMKVLLDPIGIPRSYIDEEKEASDILLGAYQEEQLVACCILTRKDPETVQLRQMAVALHLQGTGVGRSLLAFAEGIGRQNGYRKLMMHARGTVLPFYVKCGYVVSGDEFSEVGIAHYPMTKQL